MTFPVIMYGGPQDGKIFVLQEDDIVVKFATTVSPPVRVTEEPVEVDIAYIQYLRTKKFASNGARIYRYVPNAEAQ